VGRSQGWRTTLLVVGLRLGLGSIAGAALAIGIPDRILISVGWHRIVAILSFLAVPSAGYQRCRSHAYFAGESVELG